MRLLRYTFQESRIGSITIPNTNGRKRKLTAMNETHARHILGENRKDRVWIKVKTEVLDFETAPPGFIPPPWLFKLGYNKGRYKGYIKHCANITQHVPHLHTTESGKIKACGGEVQLPHSF